MILELLSCYVHPFLIVVAILHPSKSHHEVDYLLWNFEHSNKKELSLLKVVAFEISRPIHIPWQ